MKILHLGDLHIGKRIYEESLLELQKEVLSQVLEAVTAEKIDAVLLAGDLYDKSAPPEMAVSLLDDFLTGLAEKNVTVLAIAGNHDSPARLQFGARLLDKAGVFVVGQLPPRQVTLEKDGVRVCFTLLPYSKPAVAAGFLETPVCSMEETVKGLLKAVPPQKDCVNILAAHLFVTGRDGALPEQCRSEQIPVGGLDSVDYRVLEGYDYVALGHLHRPQWVGRETVRYSGSLLKYSFSEAAHTKSAVLLDIDEKGGVAVSTIPLYAKKDMRVLTGCVEDLLQTSEVGDCEDYFMVRLTDEQPVYDAMAKLRTRFPNVLELEHTVSFSEGERGQALSADTILQGISETELMEQFYQAQKGQALSVSQKKILEEIWSAI